MSIDYDDIARPTVTRNDDGSLTLDWPEDAPEQCLMAREVLVEIVAEQNELRALKARRCDGCAHASHVDVNSGWNPDEYRQCNVQAQADAPMFSDCSGRTAKWQEIVVDVSHSCASWTEKP